MPAEQREERQAAAGECRQCRAFCDKLVDPAGCVGIGCAYLYSYTDELSGNRYMGCLQKVFKGEIDIDLFEEAEMGAGYGGLKMTGQALPQCQFTVERSYEGKGAGYECVNPRFFDFAEGEGGFQVFDLRTAVNET